MVQYLYVKNGPLTFIDTLGRYLIRATSSAGGSVSYELIKEDAAQVFRATTIKEFIPLGNWFIQAEQLDNNIVGGNGYENNATVKGIYDLIKGAGNASKKIGDILIWIGDNAFTRTGKTIQATTSNANISSLTKQIGMVFRVYTIAKHYGDATSRIKNDDVIFELLKIIEAEDGKVYTKSKNMNKLTNMMDELISFVRSGDGSYAIDQIISNLKNLRIYKDNYAGTYDGRTNYYYFFVCMVNEVLKNGHHPGSTQRMLIRFGSITPWDVDYNAYIAGSKAAYNSGYKKELVELFREVNSKKSYEIQTKGGKPLTETEFKKLIDYDKAYSRAEHYIGIAKQIVHKYW